MSEFYEIAMLPLLSKRERLKIIDSVYAGSNPAEGPAVDLGSVYIVYCPGPDDLAGDYCIAIDDYIDHYDNQIIICLMPSGNIVHYHWTRVILYALVNDLKMTVINSGIVTFDV